MEKTIILSNGVKLRVKVKDEDIEDLESYVIDDKDGRLSFEIYKQFLIPASAIKRSDKRIKSYYKEHLEILSCLLHEIIKEALKDKKSYLWTEITEPILKEITKIGINIKNPHKNSVSINKVIIAVLRRCFEKEFTITDEQTVYVHYILKGQKEIKDSIDIGKALLENLSIETKPSSKRLSKEFIYVKKLLDREIDRLRKEISKLHKEIRELEENEQDRRKELEKKRIEKEKTRQELIQFSKSLTEIRIRIIRLKSILELKLKEKENDLILNIIYEKIILPLVKELEPLAYSREIKEPEPMVCIPKKQYEYLKKEIEKLKDIQSEQERQLLELKKQLVEVKN